MKREKNIELLEFAFAIIACLISLLLVWKGIPLLIDLIY
jgi:hypothetical protein